MLELKISNFKTRGGTNFSNGFKGAYEILANDVDKEYFQLFGAAAIWIASKYEDSNYPIIDDLVYICADSYTKK